MNKKRLLIIFVAALICSGLIVGSYFTLKSLYKIGSQKEIVNNNPSVQPSATPSSSPSPSPSPSQVSYPYTLIAHTGQVFGAKVPKGWSVTDNESGIDIFDPSDNNTGASGAVAVGWPGTQTPDSFIEFMLNAVGAKDVKYENESAKETIKDPVSGLSWVMKTKTFTFTNQKGTKIKAKASAGVLNGYGQFCGMITAFQTTPEKWGQWAPTLERIAKSITIINPSKAGGIDKVKLPTAADLANDSSPIMESWEYRNKVTDRTSHEFSDAIMGQESDLYSPSTGQNFTRPLSAYDPTIGGYRNPNKPSEILVDPYAR